MEVTFLMDNRPALLRVPWECFRRGRGWGGAAVAKQLERRDKKIKQTKRGWKDHPSVTGGWKLLPLLPLLSSTRTPAPLPV